MNILEPINLGKNELQNAVIQNLATAPSSPVEGQIYYDSSVADKTAYFWNGVAWVAMGGALSGINSFTVDNASIEDIGTPTDPSIRVKAGGITDAMLAGSISNSKLTTNPLARANHTGSQAASTISDLTTVVKAYRLDEFADPNSDIPMAGQKFTGLADPSSAQDSATKAYVDSVAAGLAPKDAARAATVVTGTLATAFENGDTIDGVVLATGDRILLKNQSAGAENGIYVVNASGAPTRATDADSSADLIGAAVFVSEGTVNADTLYVLTTNGPITVGTTALVFSQFAGPGTYTAGAGLTLTGTQFSLTSPVAIANGGTGQITADAARNALGAPGRYTEDVGDNSSTSIVVTHNLNTRSVIVQVHRATTPWDVVLCGIQKTSVNTVTLTFTIAPTTDEYTVTVIGG